MSRTTGAAYFVHAVTGEVVVGNAGAAAAGAQREVLSLEMDRAGLADLLAKLDAIQSQVDSLT